REPDPHPDPRSGSSAHRTILVSAPLSSCSTPLWPPKRSRGVRYASVRRDEGSLPNRRDFLRSARRAREHGFPRQAGVIHTSTPAPTSSRHPPDETRHLIIND